LVAILKKPRMWFRVKDFLSVEISTSPQQAEACGQPLGVTTRLTDLPDEILMTVLMLLSPRDLISVEGSCSRLRSVVVHYNAYRHKLDRILRSKKLNNYMLLSERSAQKKSNQEVSQYYKYRLYKYVYRSRLKPIPPSDDDYLRTYKTKQKQEELDSLVAEQTRRLSLKLIL